MEKANIIIHCPCGKDVITSPSRLKRKKYCSLKCKYKYRKRPNGLKYNFVKPNKGRFKKGQFVGKKHYNWRGGITPLNEKIRKSIEFRLWREAVFARDNYICQKCGKREIYINAHHIKPFAQFPELRLAINNGITLCKKCHKEYHKKYGKK